MREPGMGPYCKACPVCNGKACTSEMPGPGAKGTGTVAIRNYEKWQDICVNMDTICENGKADTSFEIFGRTYKAPIFAAPIGAMKLHYGDKYDDLEYNNILVPACADAGIAAFTGDGVNAAVMEGATMAIRCKRRKSGIPTVKPWDVNTLQEKLELIKASGSLCSGDGYRCGRTSVPEKSDSACRKQDDRRTGRDRKAQQVYHLSLKGS